MKPEVQELIETRGPEQIAKAIQDIQFAMIEMNKSRLTRAALVALIHDRSGVAKGTIHVVLNNLDNIGTDWLKPVPAVPTALKK